HPLLEVFDSRGVRHRTAAATKGSRMGDDEERFGDRQLRSDFALPALTVAAFAPGTGLSS
ncbi:MAG: hypothetical protein OXJ64_14960, partial [Boseongicola sp.]|nr:hypothetical protein [Boseongicola sp.]